LTTTCGFAGRHGAVFQGLGYSVTANNGAEAMEAMKKDPDISLLFSRKGRAGYNVSSQQFLSSDLDAYLRD
jgi:hypothetical protein